MKKEVESLQKAQNQIGGKDEDGSDKEESIEGSE
jgi:hypothetical protein